MFAIGNEFDFSATFLKYFSIRFFFHLGRFGDSLRKKASYSKSHVKMISTAILVIYLNTWLIYVSG